MMFQSIRWRIAIPYVGLILLLMISTGVFLSYIVRQVYVRSLENQLINQAILIRDNLRMNFSQGDIDMDEDASQLAELLNNRVTLIAADGSVVGESHDDRQRMDNHSNRPEIIQASSQEYGSSTRFSHTEGYEMLYIAVPVRVNAELAGFIRLALPVNEIEATISQIQRGFVLFTALAAGAAILLAMWIASRTTRPLLELTAGAERLAAGNFEGHIIQKTTDEVGQLTKTFNKMSDQLGQQIRALESERSKLSAVLNEMSDGVIILDANGRIQLINPAAETMFGVLQSQVIGLTLIEAFRQHQLVDLWNLTQKTGEPQDVLIEIPIRRLYLHTVAATLGNALPGSTLLLIQDLTHLHHLETVRQDFMSNISHELRTPLASLKALTETLQESALDDPPAARRFLQLMEAEVDALSLVVSELFELSRIESGRVPLKMETRSAGELIERAVARLQLQAERAGLNIRSDCQPELPPVQVDAGRMEQVLVNLLHNAIKFTPAGGSILISCRLVENTVQISVQDTGIGISSEDLPRIFERFYKTDRARSTGGTGLGLAISRHLVEAHGGKIWAESVEGQGSTFYITIPLG